MCMIFEMAQQSGILVTLAFGFQNNARITY